MTLVVRPGEGSYLPGDFEVLVKVRSEDTNAAMAVIEETVPPRTLVPPHTHQNDVWAYVLSGEIGVLVGEEIALAGPGSWALKPRNVMHATWNSGAEPARVIEVLTPGGTERWFEEINRLAEGDRHGFVAACARHGIHFLPDSPWIEKLRSKYALL